MDFQTNLKKYADLIVHSGCSLQKNQELLISAPVQCADFVHMVAESAYRAGAKSVTVDWSDEKLARLSYDYSPMDVFQNYPKWKSELLNGAAERGAAILSIGASDPEIMKGVNPAKVGAAMKSSHLACKPFHDSMDFGRSVWCCVAAASPAWAKKVFPNVNEDEAVEKLWEAIFRAVRVDSCDPQKAWQEHRKSFQQRIEFLNDKKFDCLNYKNSLGTDISVGLPKNHVWQGGGAETVYGTFFFPNMPTEEIFTSPDRCRVNGTVYSALPLNYQGNIIDRFHITYKNGQAVDFDAETGKETLSEILHMDNGAEFLGEVALIPRKSPIAEMGILFYNTLYDENASCHFAIGQGFPECIQDGLEMTEEQLLQSGINHSSTHVDFMLGTDDLMITGVEKDGKQTLLFKNGSWAI